MAHCAGSVRRWMPARPDQTGAHAEPAGRVVVSGDHHGGYADGGEPVQGPVEELHGGQRRHGPVVDVTRHQDGVDLALAHGRHQMVEEVGLGVEQAQARWNDRPRCQSDVCRILKTRLRPACLSSFAAAPAPAVRLSRTEPARDGAAPVAPVPSRNRPHDPVSSPLTVSHRRHRPDASASGQASGSSRAAIAADGMRPGECARRFPPLRHLRTPHRPAPAAPHPRSHRPASSGSSRRRSPAVRSR